mmetsp:Transcript_23505/g.59061  ORF Transcript_23505/g.59061 Transcript_23505/m.59061 type:complete len:202 (+) Transcript_23505:1205-1810(+)
MAELSRITRNSIWYITLSVACFDADNAASASSNLAQVSSTPALRVRSSVSTVWIFLAISSVAAFCFASYSLYSFSCSAPQALGSVSSQTGRSTANSAIPSSGRSSVPPIIMVNARAVLLSAAFLAICASVAAFSAARRAASSSLMKRPTDTSSSRTTKRRSSLSRSSSMTGWNPPPSSSMRASPSGEILSSSRVLSSIRAL